MTRQAKLTKAECGQLGGLKGGRTRAEKMTDLERRDHCTMMAHKRWAAVRLAREREMTEAREDTTALIKSIKANTALMRLALSRVIPNPTDRSFTLNTPKDKIA